MPLFRKQSATSKRVKLLAYIGLIRPIYAILVWIYSILVWIYAILVVYAILVWQAAPKANGTR